MDVTLVMNNWRRPQNVERIVREARCWATDAIVVDSSGSCIGPAVRMDRDRGLYSRFALGLMATTGIVLIQDDDLLLAPQTVDALIESWRTRPLNVHGTHGRLLPYTGKDAHGDVPIVLTRALVCSTCLLADFFCHVPLFGPEMIGAVPIGNGEDIILSYVARWRSGGLMNVAVPDLGWEELPAPDAIHSRAGNHWEHRRRLTRRLDRWLMES